MTLKQVQSKHDLLTLPITNFGGIYLPLKNDVHNTIIKSIVGYACFRYKLSTKYNDGFITSLCDNVPLTIEYECAIHGIVESNLDKFGCSFTADEFRQIMFNCISIYNSVIDFLSKNNKITNLEYVDTEDSSNGIMFLRGPYDQHFTNIEK